MRYFYIRNPDGSECPYGDRGPSKPSQFLRATVVSPKEFSKITSHLEWQANQVKEANLRNEQVRATQVCSQNIVKTWRNTLVNKQRERLDKRRQRLQSIEDFKNKLFEKSCLEKEIERKKKLDDVRRFFLLQRDDIKAINSAFVFTEVLRERQEQLKYKDKQLEREKQLKKEFDERVKKDVELYLENEKKLKESEWQTKLKRRKDLIDDIKERTGKQDKQLELQQQKEELRLLQEEIKLIEENSRKEAEQRSEICRRDLLESKRNAEEKIKHEKSIEEDQEKAINIYLKFKKRIDCLIKKQLEAERQELRERQKQIYEKVAACVQEAESKRSQWEQVAFKSSQASSDADQKKRDEKIARMKQELMDARTESLQQVALEEAYRKNVSQWEAALCLKRAEVDKIRELKLKEEEWKKKMKVRRGYNLQIEEHRIKAEEERLDDLRRCRLALYEDRIVDEAFFKYADEYAAAARKNGASDYPIRKEIKRYRERHHLAYQEKHERRRREDELRWRALPEGGATGAVGDHSDGGGRGGSGGGNGSDGGGRDRDQRSEETALTVWKPQPACPLICAEGQVAENGICVSPVLPTLRIAPRPTNESQSFQLPLIRDAEICAKKGLV